MASVKLFLFQGVLFTYMTMSFSKLSYDCGTKLLDGCFCGIVYADRSTKYMVNCTDQHFKSVEMLKYLPKETESLVFVGNDIPKLPWNIFGDLNNLTSLKSIDMSNNKIQEIKGKAYHHVPNVETLILNHNKLTISDTDDDNYHHPRVFSNFINLQQLHLTDAFADNTDAALADDLHDIFVNSNLTKLFKLHLEQNEIKSFRDADVFCDLPSLRDLYLGDNFIPSLNFNVRCLKNLRFIDFEHNNITKFTQRDFDNFDRLAPPYRAPDNVLMIDISRNPFKCDTAVKGLFNWIQKTNVTIRNKDNLQCNLNKYGSKYTIHLKTLAEGKHAKVSRAITILLVILALILVSLLGAYVYISKKKIQSKLGPLIDKVTRKVQYTTIESQDV